MRILFVGDVVGKPGRDAVLTMTPLLRAELRPDLVIVNAENEAAGLGITPEIARTLLANGMDVLTLGNHAWSRREVGDYLACEPRVLRPANYPPGSPGRGHGLYKTPGGALVAVANLNGRTFMEPLDDPFRADPDLDLFLPDSSNVPYDMRDVIGRAVDGGEFF